MVKLRFGRDINRYCLRWWKSRFPMSVNYSSPECSWKYPSSSSFWTSNLHKPNSICMSIWRHGLTLNQWPTRTDAMILMSTDFDENINSLSIPVHNHTTRVILPPLLTCTQLRSTFDITLQFLSRYVQRYHEDRKICHKIYNYIEVLFLILQGKLHEARSSTSHSWKKTTGWCYQDPALRRMTPQW